MLIFEIKVLLFFLFFLHQLRFCLFLKRVLPKNTPYVMLFLPLRVWNGVNDSGTEGGGACSIPHV